MEYATAASRVYVSSSTAVNRIHHLAAGSSAALAMQERLKSLLRDTLQGPSGVYPASSLPTKQDRSRSSGQITVKILEYTGLDTSRVKASYRKVVEAITRNDFRAAQVKKLANLSHGKFYRARLDDADRLLFTLIRHADETCALMLEVISNHDYDKSRFLRGAAIDESKIPDIEADEAIKEAQPCVICTRSAPAFICSTSRFLSTTRRTPSIASRRR
jgi:hypothetical protein